MLNECDPPAIECSTLKFHQSIKSLRVDLFVSSILPCLWTIRRPLVWMGAVETLRIWVVAIDVGCSESVALVDQLRYMHVECRAWDLNSPGQASFVVVGTVMPALAKASSNNCSYTLSSLWPDGNEEYSFSTCARMIGPPLDIWFLTMILLTSEMYGCQAAV